MKVKKTFVADGKKYRPGDEPPEMDKAKADHYLRYGMIGPADADADKGNEQSKAELSASDMPAGGNGRVDDKPVDDTAKQSPAPTETKPAKPKEKK